MTMAGFDDAAEQHDWDDQDDPCGYGDGGGCNTCGGEGFIVVCVDDMCRGAGECMHGDGEAPCPDCGGHG
jgi:hypothetical protein